MSGWDKPTEIAVAVEADKVENEEVDHKEKTTGETVDTAWRDHQQRMDRRILKLDCLRLAVQIYDINAEGKNVYNAETIVKAAQVYYKFVR